MKTVKTLYISDLDGTLLNYNAELSAYSKASLNRMVAAGLHFSVATARTGESSFKILDGVSWNVPLVLLNGVLIYDFRQEKYMQVLSILPETATAITSALKSLNMTGLMYQLKNDKQLTYYETLEHEPIRNFMEGRKVRYNKMFYETDSFVNIAPEGTIYFTLIDVYDKIRLAYEELAMIPDIFISVCKDIYSEDLWFLDIYNNKATKENGIIYLRETYGFDRVVGFGDNLNDLPLFAACDVRVAVENAKEEVRTAADFICDTNENDGVVRWIETRING